MRLQIESLKIYETIIMFRQCIQSFTITGNILPFLKFYEFFLPSNGWNGSSAALRHNKGT